MTDSESRNPAANGGGRTAKGRTGKAGKPEPRRRKGGGPRGRSSRTGLLHQSRVMAMQALYEEDLTDHELDDILQHMGEDHRRTLTEAFARVRGSAVNVVETLVFLVRQADLDSPESAVQRFDDASGKALRGLAGMPVAPDGEGADDESGVQSRVEAIAIPILEAFRATARGALQASLAASPEAAVAPESDEPARELADHLAQRQREPVLDDDGSVEVGEDTFEAQRQKTIARLRETLGQEERTMRAAMMDMLQRTGRLARGVRAYEHEIDPRIERAAPAFPIPQLASIDRSVLRVALYELLFEPDVPFKVVINEAVDIAKQYGGPNSGKFVNGVLRTISESLPAARTATP
jgi:transcription antitermination factor NusB